MKTETGLTLEFKVAQMGKEIDKSHDPRWSVSNSRSRSQDRIKAHSTTDQSLELGKAKK